MEAVKNTWVAKVWQTSSQNSGFGREDICQPINGIGPTGAGTSYSAAVA